MKVNSYFVFIKKVIFCFCTILLLESCAQKTFDTNEELIEYVNNPENGYSQQKSVNGVDYEITYRPTDMVVKQLLNNNYKNEEVDSLRNEYGKYIYLNLSLSKNNKEILNSMVKGRVEFGAMVNQLAFKMGKKVHLMNQARDTLELLDYIYPREYGMGRTTNMMFVYSRNQNLLKGDYIQLTIEDIGLSTGEVGFKIASKLLKNEPKLKL